MDAPMRPEGLMERGVVFDAKIAAKPDQRRGVVVHRCPQGQPLAASPWPVG
jgi:hypothetical protein